MVLAKHHLIFIFTVSEPCFVIHIREKDQRDAHFS